MQQTVCRHPDIRALYQATVLWKQQGWLGSTPVPRHYASFGSKQTQKLSAQARKNLKRRHYLDEVQKKARQVPGPGEYKFNYSSFTRPTSAKSKKQFTERLKSVPNENPPCEYNVKFGSQFKRKKSPLPRSIYRSHIDGAQSRSSEVPGPGFYNPYGQIRKIKPNTVTPAETIKKDLATQRKQLKKIKQSTVGSKKDRPLPVSYRLFSHTEQNNHVPNRHYLGKSKRFESKRPKTPGPGHYDLDQRWVKVEEGSMRVKSAPWFKLVSSRPDRSIYY